MEETQKTTDKKATFIVQVQYCENSTWQGEVKWVEHDEGMHFRSMLELVKLMDSAIEKTSL